MRAIDFAAIISGLIAAAPISAAADTFSFTFTSPSITLPRSWAISTRMEVPSTKSTPRPRP